MVIQKQIETLEQEKFVLDGSGNVAVRTTAVLETGDIEIGAVEIKDGSSDTRVKVADGSTMGVTDNAQAVADANVKVDTSAIKNSVELIDDVVVVDNASQSATPKIVNVGGEYQQNNNEYSDGDATIIQSDIKGYVKTAGYDDTLQVNKNIEQSPLWSRYTSPVEIVSEQNLTTSYADFGSLQNVQGYTHVGFIVAGDVNDSQDCTLKVVGEMTASGTDEIEFETGGSKTLWSGTGSDFIKYYEFDVSAMPFIKTQAKVGTVGSTSGDLTINIVKIWRP